MKSVSTSTVSGAARDGFVCDERNAVAKGGRNRSLVLVIACCLLAEVSLVLLDLYVNWYRWSDSGAIRRLFNITREDGLASLFAIMQTMVVAMVLWAIYLVSLRLENGKAGAAGWLALALFFSYMVIDDGAMVHERIGSAFKKANQGIDLPSYTWQFVLAPFFILMGIFMTWLLWLQGSRKIRRGWLIAAMACLGMAILLDYVEGLDAGYQFLVDSMGWSEKTIAHFSKSLEEFLEMLGMTLLLMLFLNYFGYLTEKVEIRIADRKIWIVERSS